MATPAHMHREARLDQPAARAVAHLIAREETTVVCVHGEVDLCTVRSLETALRDAYATRAPRTVVELGSVGFMDGAGLRALRAAKLRFDRAGRSFAVRGARRAVLRLFEAAQADELLEDAADVLPLR